MNVTATTTSNVSSSQSQTNTNSSSKTSEKSFDEEVQAVSEDTNKTTAEKDTPNKAEEKDSTTEANKIVQELKTPDDIISEEAFSGAINFTDFKYHNVSQSLLSQNIQNLLNTKDLMTTVNSASRVDYDVVNMSESDANFFADLVQNTDMSMKSISEHVNNALVEGSENIQQNIKVSSVLMEKLSESLKTNQPFRIDFDKDISVIIRVNKDGSLAANFIPGDKAVEQYLKNNISFLKQRFDEQELSYSELSYSNSRQQQKQKNKENDNE